MGFAEWVQVVSVAGLICALLISHLQNRNTARQAREAADQTRAARQALERTGYQGFMRAQADWRSFTYVRDPELLRWHLQIRGYPVDTDEANRRTLYVLLKLDVHEESFLSRRSGLLDDDIWVPWQRVLDADLRVPEFISLWSFARPFYAQSFVDHVDKIFDHQAAVEAVDTAESHSLPANGQFAPSLAEPPAPEGVPPPESSAA
ncbi:hypothetical protein [Phytomonospora endophytica]|uniref:Uncharacterized protein n=1 Tax=Phytomonospora endophytica TaxID=714109 RepID=A0A841FF99_9ACTN|nr:hypothetical protein [Phytomonospora endophytica]MBB6032242.1 hypothetical protein [Phytomonospora endophytica]GIG68592.1 hypothetical protein Pen01_48870 [Phytomonospora endophytica]